MEKYLETKMKSVFGQEKWVYFESEKIYESGNSTGVGE